MILESLKSEVMDQARRKDWGTSEKEVNIPTKLALLNSEIGEVGMAHEVQKEMVENNREFWRDYGGMAALGYMGDRPYFNPGREDTGDALAEYQEEWSDVLIRTLHLGGVVNTEFPDTPNPYIKTSREEVKRELEGIESEPIASNDTEEGRYKNRRVEVVPLN